MLQLRRIPATVTFGIAETQGEAASLEAQVVGGFSLSRH
jgi:hypothetical protein